MVIGNYWANTGKQVTKSVQKRDSTDWDLFWKDQTDLSS